MRQIFYKEPVFTLTQYMIVQLKIRKIVDNPLLMRTPDIMEIVFKHFEGLVQANHTSRRKLLSSFYDLNNIDTFEKEWDGDLERDLTETKNEINVGKFRVDRLTDTRVHAQLVIEFIETLREPAISRTTVSHLANQVNVGMSSQAGHVL